MITTYEQAEAFFAKARDVSKGRPLHSYAWRLHKDGDCYPVWVQGQPLGRYNPDNTFVFTMPDTTLRRFSQSISATADRNLPFRVVRLSPERFRVASTYLGEAVADGPEYFAGLTYDLTNRRWVNARPDALSRVNKEARREWLRALKAWKRTVKTLARLGVLERIEPDRGAPYIYSDAGVDKLYKIIATNDVSEASLAWVKGNLVAYYGPYEGVGYLYGCIENLLSRHSFSLRKRFGVFDGEDA
jgi:hypothetical protein